MIHNDKKASNARSLNGDFGKEKYGTIVKLEG